LRYAKSKSIFGEMAELTKVDLTRIQDTELKLSTKFATDPDKFLKDIGGRKCLRDMIYDAEVKAGIETRRTAVRNVEWSLQGSSEMIKEFIKDQLKPQYANLINNTWSSVLFGYSVFQAVWKVEDTLFMIDKIHDEKFENFAINEDFELLPTYSNKIKKDELYPEKFFVTVHNQSSKYPMGEPLLATVYFAWLFSRNGLDFYMELLESYGKPFIHVKSNSGSEANKRLIAEILSARRPRGVGSSSDIEIELVESIRGGEVFSTFNKMMEEKIQRALLGQTLTSGTQGQGSQSLGTVHNQVRMERVVSDCEGVKPTIQKLINTICELNGITDIPTFEFNFPKVISMDRVERDLKLDAMGVKFTQKYISEKYDLEADDFEIIRTADNPFGSGMFEDKYFADHAVEHKCFALNGTQEAQQRAGERLENAAIERAGNILDVEEVQIILSKAKSRKDLEKRLQFYIAQDAPEFDDALTQLLYQRRLQGNVDGQS
jgi:phage gp29-like protein